MRGGEKGEGEETLKRKITREDVGQKSVIILKSLQAKESGVKRFFLKIIINACIRQSQ